MLYSEIKENVLKETGITSAHYDFVISDFWRSIREILSHPESIRLGLRLEGFGTWWMHYWKIKALNKQKKPGQVDTKGNNTEFYQELEDNLTQLIKTYKNGKARFNNE